MKKAFIAISTVMLLMLYASAFAQESTVQRTPTEEEKRAALLMALKLRGNFSGGPMVDLTNPATLAAYGNMIANETPANELPKTVQTVEVAPTQPIRADICQRHGKRKVMTNGGKSWRCR